MRKTRVCFAVGCCLLAITTLTQAQSKRKAGLWEVTTTMSMGGAAMPAMPQGMPQGAGGPMGGSHTTQVCVTQAMIDKYGGPYQNPPRGDCTVTNLQTTATGMTATISCTGQMSGTGTVETTFVDADTAQTKVHISGTMQMGQNSRPIDVTLQSKSVFKSPDCGSVKPIEMPAAK